MKFNYGISKNSFRLKVSKTCQNTYFKKPFPLINKNKSQSKIASKKKHHKYFIFKLIMFSDIIEYDYVTCAI